MSSPQAPSAPPSPSPKPKPDRLDFGQPEPRHPGYVEPTEDSLAGLAKKDLRERLKRSGILPSLMASFLTKRELKLILLGAYPFTAKGYGINDTFITEPAALFSLCANRRDEWHRVENARVQSRRALKRETLGEAAEELDPEEIVQRLVAGRIFIGIIPHPQRIGPETVERFYDIDGRAGNAQYYEFWDQRDIENGRPKEGAIALRVSPESMEKYVDSNPLVREHFIKAVGHGMPDPNAPKRTPRQGSTAAPRQRQRRTRPARTVDLLADVEEVV